MAATEPTDELGNGVIGKSVSQGEAVEKADLARTWARISGATAAAAEHAPAAGPSTAAAAEAIREIGHELLSLPLHFLFICS